MSNQCAVQFSDTNNMNICSSECCLTFSVFVCELKGLDKTQGLLNRASHWEVIYGNLSQDTLGVDDEQTSV